MRRRPRWQWWRSSHGRRVRDGPLATLSSSAYNLYTVNSTVPGNRVVVSYSRHRCALFSVSISTATTFLSLACSLLLTAALCSSSSCGTASLSLCLSVTAQLESLSLCLSVTAQLDSLSLPLFHSSAQLSLSASLSFCFARAFDVRQFLARTRATQRKTDSRPSSSPGRAGPGRSTMIGACLSPALSN